jgi:hypothetical protein
VSTEPGQLFAALRQDLGDVVLAQPADLRQIGSRRNRVNWAATVVAAAAAVSALAVGAAWAIGPLGRPTSQPGGGASGTPSTSVAPSTVPSTAPSDVASTPEPGTTPDGCSAGNAIPYLAFLQPADSAAHG